MKLDAQLWKWRTHAETPAVGDEMDRSGETTVKAKKVSPEDGRNSPKATQHAGAEPL